MLGCKSSPVWNHFLISPELIDTCWDVNLVANIDGNGNNGELIDTCWDVNLFEQKFKT